MLHERGPLQYFGRENIYCGQPNGYKASGNSQHAFTRKKPSLITLSVICMHPGALGTLLHRFLRLLQP